MLFRRARTVTGGAFHLYDFVFTDASRSHIEAISASVTATCGLATRKIYSTHLLILIYTALRGLSLILWPSDAALKLIRCVSLHRSQCDNTEKRCSSNCFKHCSLLLY